MYHKHKIVVVLPAYNAERTLEQTYREIPRDIVDDVILVDDYSSDHTAELAQRLGVAHVIRHDKNKGYGGNQKSCYNAALKLHADIVIMLHPDYQYTPKLITAMASVIADGVYPVVIGSRILGGGALRGGMPLYKYYSNRLLTLFQNFLMGQKLSEYHTGFRAYHSRVLKAIDYNGNSDDFIFDNEVIAQIFHHRFEIAEITCPTKYFKEASSINFRRSVKYGLGVMMVSVKYFLHHKGIMKWGRLKK
ncbi:MAG TPA: glycosyltransferase family 2 protein [Bacteroidia bacterium]|nr:glycosyltransferase family 2 protein [Bacteroidia bacterium]